MMGHAEMMNEGPGAHPGVADMSDEQRADFSALRAGAAEEMAHPGQEQDIQGPDLAGEITGLVLMLVAVANPMFPSLSGIYTKEATAQAAAAIAALCRKHGWLQGGLAQGHGEEVAAAIVLLPLAWATYSGVKGDLQKAKGKEAAQARMEEGVYGKDTATGNGSKALSFGNVVPIQEGAANAVQ
jgi:hypothetical protein